MSSAASEFDAHCTFDNQKNLVRIFMVMPHKIALKLCQFELIIVHFSDHTWRPVLRKLSEFFG
tara:strand:+ start:828 stop:1016 length:189 start_codon:yes stop_codon:yes gene_type:complete